MKTCHFAYSLNKIVARTKALLSSRQSQKKLLELLLTVKGNNASITMLADTDFACCLLATSTWTIMHHCDPRYLFPALIVEAKKHAQNSHSCRTIDRFVHSPKNNSSA